MLCASKVEGFQAESHRVVVAIALLSLIAFPTTIRAESLGFPSSSDFHILNGDGSEIVGSAHYAVSEDGPGSYLLYGENRFLDGEYDIEEDRIESGGASRPTALTSYKHEYFNSDGSLQRVAQADLRAGEGSCVIYENGHAQESRARFDFPPDTYSGSTVLIPLTDRLRKGYGGPIRFHNFNCVPGPRLLTIEAHPSSGAEWEHYPGQLVEVRIKPDFGWLNAFIAPFVPKMDAWFEPSRDWAYVGGKEGRFYRGPEIILVGAAGSSGVASKSLWRGP
jgi:hypothetical protein